MLINKTKKNMLTKIRDEAFNNKGIGKVHIFEKATKFCEISTEDLSYVVKIKSTVEISQNLVAFSECMNFNYLIKGHP